MSDSDTSLSFRIGWLPTGFSREATLCLQRYADQFVLLADFLYYFKPIETFVVVSLSSEEKFEEIDSYIVREFDCDPDDIITLSSPTCDPVVVVPESVLIRAGVPLPPWREPRSRKRMRFPRLTVVAQ